MKNIKYIIQAAAICLVLIVSSCKKDFYTNANVDPNTPPSITPASSLSSIEGALAYTQGGTFDLFITSFDQQTKGINVQTAAYYNYVVSNEDLDDPWDNFYTNVFSTCKQLKDSADAKGYNAYSGVARILMAYTLQINVDAWGNMPYSTALQGVADLYPTYDPAATIYTDINGLVDAGIADLSNASPGGLTPGAEDVIYAANASSWSAAALQWIKFGHAIKARLAIHQSKNNSAMATTALSEISMSFASNADNAQYTFGTTAFSANPWNQFNLSRGYQSYAQATIASMLTALNDPRYPIYIDSATDGAGQGLGAYYGSGNSPVEFITYDELQFVVAEANLRLSNAGAAQTAFTGAITANFSKLGVSSGATTTYLAAHGTLPVTAADAIDSVAQQEYLALYLNPEAWTVWRRTNSPALTPTAGVNGIPRRFEYPQSEYSYNLANVNAQGVVTLWAPKIFWDN